MDSKDNCLFWGRVAAIEGAAVDHYDAVSASSVVGET